MRDLHIASSPLTGTIFCGTVSKDGRTWGANKKDVTIEALVSVAEHVIKFGKPVTISKEDGTPEYKIIVEKPDVGWGDSEKKTMADIIRISAPSLDPERFEALADAINQVAKNRNIDFSA